MTDGAKLAVSNALNAQSQELNLQSQKKEIYLEQA